MNLSEDGGAGCKVENSQSSNEQLVNETLTEIQEQKKPQFIVPDLSKVAAQDLHQLSELNSQIWRIVKKNPLSPQHAFKNSVIQILNSQIFAFNKVQDTDSLTDIHRLLLRTVKLRQAVLALQYGQDWYIVVGFNFTHRNPVDAYSHALENGQFWLIMSSCSQDFPNFMSKKWSQIMMAVSCPQDSYVNLHQRKPEIRKAESIQQKRKAALWELVVN